MQETGAADALTPAMEVDPYALMVDFYDEWSAHMTDDVPFYVARAREASPGPVVELGAGDGRVAIEIARAGMEIAGVEPSDAMRTEGERRAAEAGVADLLRFVPGDMRTFVADPPVPLVIIPFRSFQHLLTTDDQLAALSAIRSSLRRGGRLVFNVFTSDPWVIAANDRVRTHRFSFSDDQGRRHETYTTPVHTLATQRVDVRLEHEVWDDDRLVGTAEAELKLRTIGRYEAEHLFARSGLVVEALYGDFDGKPYGPGPDEMIWIVRNP